MANKGNSVEEILDTMSYQVENLPHPVDLLSADLIADISDVPKTTLLSAASSLDALRADVLARAISLLDVVPGAATWAAMRGSLTDPRANIGLAAIMSARADELAVDPAFPYFLSGFDRLASDGVANAVSSVCSLLGSELAPFADTVLHAAGEDCTVASASARFSLLSNVLAMAVQRLTTGGLLDAEVHQRVAANAGSGVVDDARPLRSGAETVDGYLPTHMAYRGPEGSLGKAVIAAADLLLSGGVPLRFGVRLDDVLRSSGVSSATFYRRFGSLAGFERTLVERTGRELVSGFRDAFFDGILTSINDGTITALEAIAELNRRADEQMSLHVETKRPGAEVLPWMATEIGTEIFAPAFMQLHRERGEFFFDFARVLGLSLADGMAPIAVASTLHSYSWTAEMLARNAPDRDLVTAFMDERSARVQQFLFGVA